MVKSVAWLCGSDEEGSLTGEAEMIHKRYPGVEKWLVLSPDLPAHAKDAYDYAIEHNIDVVLYNYSNVGGYANTSLYNSVDRMIRDCDVLAFSFGDYDREEAEIIRYAIVKITKAEKVAILVMEHGEEV
jgi:hypothetical protein